MQPYISLEGFIGKEPAYQENKEKGTFTVRINVAYTFNKDTTEWYYARMNGRLDDDGLPTGMAAKLLDLKQGDLIHIDGTLGKWTPENSSESLNSLDIRSFHKVSYEKRQLPEVPSR